MSFIPDGDWLAGGGTLRHTFILQTVTMVILRAPWMAAKNPLFMFMC